MAVWGGILAVIMFHSGGIFRNLWFYIYEKHGKLPPSGFFPLLREGQWVDLSRTANSSSMPIIEVG